MGCSPVPTSLSLDGDTQIGLQRPEDHRGLLPAEPLGPRGQEETVTECGLMLSVGPRHFLDRDATARTVHAAHTVEEEHWNCPQWHELEGSLGKRVIAGTFATTATANRSTSRVRPQRNVQRCAVVVPEDRLVNKALLLFDVIEDSLKLHLVRWVGRCFCVNNNINNRFADKMHFFLKQELG